MTTMTTPTSTTPTESHLTAADGRRVPHVAWPVAEARARLLFVHGRGEHGRRYEPVAAALAAERIECHAIDLRGFGRTVGAECRPGSMRRFEEHILDVDAGVKRALEGGRPVFVLGHSAGGLAAIRWAEEQGPSTPKGVLGLVLSSPFLAMPVPLPGLKRAIVKVLSLVAPDKPLPSSATPNTRDEACWRRYVEDPLTVRSATPRWVAEVLKHQAVAMQRASSIRVPVLVLQGGEDTATSPDASRRFADRCRGDYKEYAGCLHEVLNEPEEDRRRILGDLTSWMQARLQPAPASPAVP